MGAACDRHRSLRVTIVAHVDFVNAESRNGGERNTTQSQPPRVRRIPLCTALTFPSGVISISNIG